MITSDSHTLESDQVLAVLRKDMEAIGYRVEAGKKKVDKITVPVLFGRNGVPSKSFDADAYNPEFFTVVEVEAGRGVTNFQFLKDLFQACMMHNVEYLVIALRRQYRSSRDFEAVINFIETLYASNRLILPLNGILILGY